MNTKIQTKLDELHDTVIAMKKCMNKLDTLKPLTYYENETKEILQELTKEHVKVTVLLGHMVKHLDSKLSKITDSQIKKEGKTKRKKD